jgi:hypothetical protein
VKKNIARNVSSDTVIKTKEVIIPELERIMEQHADHPVHYWNDREVKLLKRYYNKIPIDKLMKEFPNRTLHAVRCQAYILGISHHPK